MSSVPDELKYSDDHEWVRTDGDIATIGITAFAVEQLGDIVFVELPTIGSAFATHDTFGVVESAKAASDLFSPIAGEVVDVNSRLEDAPETLNDDPYGEGWIMQVKMSDSSQLDGLKDAESYRAMTAEDA